MSTDVEAQDTHFEIELDEEPDTRKPVYVDVVAKDDTRRPIIPAQWRGKDNIKATVRYKAGEVAHRAGYHAVRSPWYATLATFWAIWGLCLVAKRQIGWWWHADQKATDERLSNLKQHAANQGDYDRWERAHKQAKSTRLYRGIVLAGEAVVLLVLYVVVRLVPGAVWAVAVMAVVAVPLLAHYGRPTTKPIVQPAVVTQRYRKLNVDIVARAYYAAGLGSPDKPNQQIEFLSTMARDPKQLGSQVLIGLPFGTTTEEAIKAKPKVASGLDVSTNQVFITRDKASNRSHWLYVADQDPLAIPAGRTPLLRLKPTDIWKPAPFGVDERGNPVTLGLMWNSVLVGAQPRKGKTFSARLLALYAALDPYVKLTVIDGKKSPDWVKFGLVAHRMVRGTTVTRDGDPVEQFIDELRDIRRHIDDVNEFLTKLPPSECPEGKLTRDLSRKYPQLRVRMLVAEEFQVYYELADPKASEEIAALMSEIMALGPSAGVIILSSSQKPSGIGASQNVVRLFTRYRDNHAVRFALKCGSRQVSEAILGTEAYGEGYDATALPVGDEYRGVGILYGASDVVPTVRTYFADGPDAEKILLAARQFREAAGLLTGEAAGEEMARQARDVLNDVRNVFYAGKATISWPALAARLKDTYPEAYADITPEAISAMVRKLGVKGKSVKDPDYFEKGVGQGCDKASVEAAIERRAIAGR